MAGARMTIRVNDAEVAKAFDRVLDAGRDMTPLLDDIGASLVVSTQHRFETETDPTGRKWTPLAKSTLRRKAPDRRILRLRSRLFGSITHNATPTYLQVGTNVKYGAIHQLGRTIDFAEREASAKFRMAKEGAYTKADGTKVGSRLRFARKRSKAKSNTTKSFTIGAHSVTIPARPYLGVSDADRKLILDKAEAYILAPVEGGAP